MELKEQEYLDNEAQYSAYISEQVNQIYELNDNYCRLNEIISSTVQQISDIDKQYQMLSKFTLLLSTTQE